MRFSSMRISVRKKWSLYSLSLCSIAVYINTYIYTNLKIEPDKRNNFAEGEVKNLVFIFSVLPLYLPFFPFFLVLPFYQSNVLDFHL